MHTIIPPLTPSRRTRSQDVPSDTEFRSPLYDCVEQDESLKMMVYVPGVDAAGVDITTRGPDLVVTARKSHVVRVNFHSLHLEGSQRDYQLRLRLGHGLDYPKLHAEIQDGVLTLVLPKKPPAHATRDRLRQVA